MTDMIIQVNSLYTPHVRREKTSLVIEGGKIVEVRPANGGDVENSSALFLDYPQGCLVPGFIDSHCHLHWWTRSRRELIIDSECGKEEVLHQVYLRTQEVERGEWIVGRGWNMNHWKEARFPNADELEEAAPHHPVALKSRDFHSIWLNRQAMSELEIDDDWPVPPGGVALRDDLGRLTGVFQEKALNRIDIPQPPVEPDEIATGLEYLYSMGITGLHVIEKGESLRLLQTLARRGELPLRVRFTLWWDQLDAALDVGIQAGWGRENLTIQGVKLFADGALGSQTAYMKAPYQESSNRGKMVIESSEMEEFIEKAWKGGLGVAVHSIGDGAGYEVIRAMKEVLRRVVPPEYGVNRLEHSQHLDPADLEDMANLGLVASMQPCHLIGDVSGIQRFLGDRQGRAFSFRSLLNRGIPLAWGTDFPIEEPNPLRNLVAAVRRDEWIEGEEGLSLTEALAPAGWGAARAMGETDVGEIAPGQRADLVIYDRDFQEVEPGRWSEMKPLLTVIEGEVVYKREESAAEEPT